MLLWFEFVLCDDVHQQTQLTLTMSQIYLYAFAYIDTKKRDTVAMIPAIGDVSHFLNSASIGEDVPLQKIISR
jgi:hypothetical protein